MSTHVLSYASSTIRKAASWAAALRGASFCPLAAPPRYRSPAAAPHPGFLRWYLWTSQVAHCRAHHSRGKVLERRRARGRSPHVACRYVTWMSRAGYLAPCPSAAFLYERTLGSGCDQGRKGRLRSSQLALSTYMYSLLSTPPPKKYAGPSRVAGSCSAPSVLRLDFRPICADSDDGR